MSSFSLTVDSDLILRSPGTADAPELFALTEVNRPYLKQWLPWLDRTVAVGDTLQFIENCRVEESKNEALTCCIWHSGSIAGMIGFHRFDHANRSTNMGYWLDGSRQGSGIITRSCRALIEFAWDKMRMNRVEIRCATGNRKSRAIPERLRFKEEGVLREAEWLYDHFVDHAVYAMLAREWKRSGDQYATHSR